MPVAFIAKALASQALGKSWGEAGQERSRMGRRLYRVS